MTLPVGIRGANYPGNQSGARKNVWRIIPLIVVGILLGTGMFLLSPLPKMFSLTGALQPTQTLLAALTTPFPLSSLSSTLPPTLTLVLPTVTATPSPLPTRTSTPVLPTFTPTYFPTPGPGFGTPFGTTPLLVIHIVQAGESFTVIADLYSTTPDVLIAVNTLKEGQTIWPGRPIVAPIGVTDPNGLPKFEVYLLPENTLLNDLATQFNTEPEQIRLYNALGPEPEIPAGRWLVIPLPAP